MKQKEKVDVNINNERKQKTQYFLLFIWGDVEPQLHGPFTSKKYRDDLAHRIRAKEGDKHGIYPVEIKQQKLYVGSYAGSFFEND